VKTILEQKLPEVGEHTTINELADIARTLEQSLILRIYDVHNEVFGAIRLVSANELKQIDRLRQQPQFIDALGAVLHQLAQRNQVLHTLALFKTKVGLRVHPAQQLKPLFDTRVLVLNLYRCLYKVNKIKYRRY